jgi:hypothetical protein
VTAARLLLDEQITEADWMGFVVSLATLRGWSVFHPYDSRRSTAGWPDLALVRGGTLILAELKTEKGKLSKAQEGWIAALEAVAVRTGGAVLVRVWRPSDADAVQEALR